jgi:hypothetical protein
MRVPSGGLAEEVVLEHVVHGVEICGHMRGEEEVDEQVSRRVPAALARDQPFSRSGDASTTTPRFVTRNM